MSEKGGNVVGRLFGSRKFVTAVVTVLADIAVVVLGKELSVEMQGTLITVITTMAGLYVAGTAAEDVAEKLNGDKPKDE